MVDTASAGGSREQTLLEAAKAFIGNDWGSQHLRNLRAAIAREEAKPADYWQTYLRSAEEAGRAQQAEASARWHRDESERLSIALAALREEHAKLREQVNSGSHTKALRERAEKAEAELAKLRAHVAKSLSMPAESTTDDLIDKDLVVLTSVINDLARTGMPLPLKVRDAMPQVVDELLQLRAEMTKVKAQRDDYAAAMQKVMDDNMKAALAGAGMPPEPVHVGIVRDPVTGWTFDTMRQQFDAACAEFTAVLATALREMCPKEPPR